MRAHLQAHRLHSGYRGVEVLHGVDLDVSAGEIVALLGPNGAGKTTTLLALAGLLPATSGGVAWCGNAKVVAAHRRARQGVTLVPERAIFRQLTVEANLALSRGDTSTSLRLFPELSKLMRRKAGLLSGGEQQMLALGRALASRPSVLLIDELSLGLAPIVVDRLFDAVRAVAQDGVGVLLVEQQIERALSIVDRGYVLVRGEVVLSGSRAELAANRSTIQSSYLA